MPSSYWQLHHNSIRLLFPCTLRLTRIVRQKFIEAIDSFWKLAFILLFIIINMWNHYLPYSRILILSLIEILNILFFDLFFKIEINWIIYFFYSIFFRCVHKLSYLKTLIFGGRLTSNSLYKGDFHIIYNEYIRTSKKSTIKEKTWSQKGRTCKKKASG